MGRDGCSFLVAVDLNHSGHSLARACSHSCNNCGYRGDNEEEMETITLEAEITPVVVDCTNNLPL